MSTMDCYDPTNLVFENYYLDFFRNFISTYQNMYTDHENFQFKIKPEKFVTDMTA